MLYVRGESTPILSERKPYVPYIVDVESSIPSQEASFSYTQHIAGSTTPMAIFQFLCKKYGWIHPHHRGRYTAFMKTMGVWTPTKYSNEVSRFKAVYGS